MTWQIVTFPNGNSKAVCPQCGALCIVEYCISCDTRNETRIVIDRQDLLNKLETYRHTVDPAHEDTVLEIMDIVAGWCGPGMQVMTRVLPSGTGGEGEG